MVAIDALPSSFSRLVGFAMQRNLPSRVGGPRRRAKIRVASGDPVYAPCSMGWIKVPAENHPIFLSALPRDPRVETLKMFGGIAIGWQRSRRMHS